MTATQIALSRTSPAFDLVPLTSGRSPSGRVLRKWLRNRSPVTIRGYIGDLRILTRWMSDRYGMEPCSRLAVLTLTQQSTAMASEVVEEWSDSMRSAGMSPRTINRRLSSVRAVVKAARLCGLTETRIEVEGLKIARGSRSDQDTTDGRKIRSTKGPGVLAVRTVFRVLAESEPTPINLRDAAVFALLSHVGLRRAEVASIQHRHLDLDGESPGLWIRGKGRGGSVERVTLPDVTARHLRAWLDVHPTKAGAVFVCLSGRWRGRDMQPTGVAEIVRKLGKLAGLDNLTPHRLRHQAVTTALDSNGGDYRRVRQFARHSSVTTTMVYDDERADVAGEIARSVATAFSID